MENMTLSHLSFFLESDIVVVKEEAPALISRLSGESLENEIDENLTLEEENDLIFEGHFEKGILVIYEGSHLEPELREFLFKILGAVGCSLKDVALTSSESVEEVELKRIEDLNPHKILIFGKLNHELSKIKKQHYEIQNEEGIEYLFADDLKEINSNTTYKKALWAKLQILFSIKS